MNQAEILHRPSVNYYQLSDKTSDFLYFFCLLIIQFSQNCLSKLSLQTCARAYIVSKLCIFNFQTILHRLHAKFRINFIIE